MCWTNCILDICHGLLFRMFNMPSKYMTCMQNFGIWAYFPNKIAITPKNDHFAKKALKLDEK